MDKGRFIYYNEGGAWIYEGGALKFQIDDKGGGLEISGMVKGGGAEVVILILVSENKQ